MKLDTTIGIGMPAMKGRREAARKTLFPEAPHGNRHGFPDARGPA
jgi:hypothetical protein